ncbi:LptA/OstA family protein [Roseicyclus marinus]|uniref:Organic solvent tolerance protein OstA n=1 Tax=Roseicyclus marinus TaxID=2161673 RepID=A0AA48HVV0_9RHOB|nr:organic solvent tolerance protein OstA [Roseicyclus marinus]
MLPRLITRPALLAAFIALAAPAGAQVAVGFGGVPHDSSQPVEVTADTLRVNETTGNAIFEGNVIVVQGDLRMVARRIEVIYTVTDGNRQVEDVVATGGVLVTRGTDAAEGDEAIYEVQTAYLTMIGNVLVTQGPSTVAGDRMEVDMTTGIGTVDGRVRTVLEGGQ